MRRARRSRLHRRILRPSERQVLKALEKADSDEVFGLDLIKVGAGNRGTIYLTLAQLHLDSLVTYKEVDLGPDTIGPRRRKVYKISLLGQVVLALVTDGDGLAKVREILEREVQDGLERKILAQGGS